MLQSLPANWKSTLSFCHGSCSSKTVEWGGWLSLVDRDRVETIAITLAVCGRPLAMSFSPKADGSMVCQVNADENECIRYKYPLVYPCGCDYIKLYFTFPGQSSSSSKSGLNLGRQRSTKPFYVFVSVESCHLKLSYSTGNRMKSTYSSLMWCRIEWWEFNNTVKTIQISRSYFMSACPWDSGLNLLKLLNFYKLRWAFKHEILVFFFFFYHSMFAAQE